MFVLWLYGSDTLLHCQFSFKGSPNLINLIASKVLVQLFRIAGGRAWCSSSICRKKLMFWEQTSPHFNSTSMVRVHTRGLDQNRSIVATLNNSAKWAHAVYSGSQWIALQPLISLLTSWTAHSQTERQRHGPEVDVWRHMCPLRHSVKEPLSK